MDNREDLLRRHNDVEIAEFKVMLKNHIERYERDYEYTQKWRNNLSEILQEHTLFINELKPAYKRGIYLVGGLIVGSLTLAIKEFWGHITWR